MARRIQTISRKRTRFLLGLGFLLLSALIIMTLPSVDAGRAFAQEEPVGEEAPAEGAGEVGTEGDGPAEQDPATSSPCITPRHALESWWTAAVEGRFEDATKCFHPSADSDTTRKLYQFVQREGIAIDLDAQPADSDHVDESGASRHLPFPDVARVVLEKAPTLTTFSGVRRAAPKSPRLESHCVAGAAWSGHAARHLWSSDDAVLPLAVQDLQVF